MSNEFDFEFDSEAVAKADKAADRINESGPYIGKFTRVAAVKTDSGARGLEFEFENAAGGDARFTVYTHSGKTGERTFGYDQVQALMLLLGAKELRAEPGKVRAYIEGQGWGEKDGLVYPALQNKPVGVVLQKELTTKSSGGDSYRWNLYGQFQPETRLTASEIRERKTRPEKLEKILKGLRDKDARKTHAAEPSQPSVGISGDY